MKAEPATNLMTEKLEKNLLQILNLMFMNFD